MPILVPLVLARSTPAFELEALTAVLLALVQIDLEYLRGNPGTPLFHQADVAYADRPEWLDVPSVLDAGLADCKSFVAWRVAELRLRGIAATPLLTPKVGGGFHARVRWPDGRLEDPSIAKGMLDAPLPP